MQISAWWEYQQVGQQIILLNLFDKERKINKPLPIQLEKSLKPRDYILPVLSVPLFMGLGFCFVFFFWGMGGCGWWCGWGVCLIYSFPPFSSKEKNWIIWIIDAHKHCKRNYRVFFPQFKQGRINIQFKCIHTNIARYRNICIRKVLNCSSHQDRAATLVNDKLTERHCWEHIQLQSNSLYH